MKTMDHEKYLKDIKKSNAVLVCMPGKESPFDNDVIDTCSKCGETIHYRPYNKGANTKICINCAMKLMDENENTRLAGVGM